MPEAARRAILDEAEGVLRGTWPVFGDEAVAFHESADWRAHPISGHNTPLRHWSTLRYMKGEAGGDVKQIWELNRHRSLLRLAQAWHLDRESRWLGPLAAHLDQWIAQNPPGKGINWASSLEVGFRALVWTWIRALTNGSEIWTAARDAAFAGQLWHHGRHIVRYDSVQHSPNTHLTGEALGLVQIGLAWPVWPGASSWVRFGQAILLEELKHQLLADGFHFERASGYHRYTTEFYLLWVVLLQQSGRPVPTVVGAELVRMLDTLAALRRPDGLLPALGDEDGGMALPLTVAHPRDPAPILAAGAALFDRGDWLWGLADAARDLAWWILDDRAWERLVTLRPVRPSWTARSFPVAGYHLMREHAEDGWWCLVDAGAHGGDRTGHAHTDLGHVELALGSVPIVADPGSLTYTDDVARRRWDRSSEAHGTLTVAEAPLARPAGPFGWRRTAPTPDVAFTPRGDGATCRLRYAWRAEDGGRITHERQVALIDGQGVVIADWVTGARGRDVRLWWPLPMPLAAIRLEAAGASLACGAVCVGWASAGGATPVAELLPQTFADTYRTPKPGSILRLSGRAHDEWVAVTWFTSAKPSLTVAIAGQQIVVTARNGRCLSLDKVAG
jgi:hypothetical protein